MKDLGSNLVTMDLVLKNNDLQVVEDDSTIGRACWAAVQTVLNTYPWDLSYGVDWPVLLSRRGEIEYRIRGAIREALRPLGVTRVESVEIKDRVAKVTVSVGGSRHLFQIGV